MKRMVIICYLLSMALFAVAQDFNLETGKGLYQRAENNSQFSWSAKTYTDAIPYLQAAMKEGFGEAAYLLGNMYLKGLGTKVDYKLAKDMFTQSIALGYDKGELELGDIYVYGLGCERDGKKAFELYAKSKERGIDDARYRIAMCWFYGIGVEVDVNVAYINSKDYLEKKGIRFGEEPDIYQMLAYFCYDEGYKTKSKQGKELTRDLPLACELLYNTGIGRYMVRAARIMYNDSIASFYQQYAGNFRVNIYKVLRDAIEAGLNLKEGAEAYFMYADHAERNDYNGLEEDIKRNYGFGRVAALTKSAELGYAPAQKMLGDWYEQGHNVSKNLIRAKEWHEKAQTATQQETSK